MITKRNGHGNEKILSTKNSSHLKFQSAGHLFPDIILFQSTIKMMGTNPFQYKEPMYISIELDLVIIITMSILVIVVNRKFLKDMKDDARKSSASLIRDVMTSRTKAFMVVVPGFKLLNWSLTLDYRFPDWFYEALCYEQYIAIFFQFYFGFDSFIISLMRYFFIVYNETALLLGKQRMKKLFYFSSIMVPLIMTVLHACTLPVPPSVHSIAQKTCHEYLEVSYNISCQTDLIGNTDNCAPILPMVLKQIPIVVTKNFGIMVKSIYIIICSNVMEGILYWRTFKIIRESQGKEFLKRALSEDCQKYRRQLISVNIKITFLSWALECTTGIGIILLWAITAEERIYRMFSLFIQFIAFVIIPCTYVLNRETTKQIIVLENWLNGLKATILNLEDAEVKVQRLEALEVERQNSA